MSLSVVQQVEREGYFERARTGDQRAASLFARLVAFRLNPHGLPNSFGWLRKGGGHQVDGYAEDAIVANSHASDLQNVYDLVTGAGRDGATAGWNGPLPRRASDTWEAPRALTTAELEYLKPGAVVAPPPVVPPVPPIPPVNLDDLTQAIQMLMADQGRLIEQVMKSEAETRQRHEQVTRSLGEVRDALKALPQSVPVCDADRIVGEILDVRQALRNGLAIKDGQVSVSSVIGRAAGSFTGKVSG